MRTHDLARKLLELPDLPVGIGCYRDRFYLSLCHEESSGGVEIAIANTTKGEHLIIGAMLRSALESYGNFRCPNYHLKKILYSDGE